MKVNVEFCFGSLFIETSLVTCEMKYIVLQYLVTVFIDVLQV